MSNEQIAHDFALEIMRMYYELNREQFTEQNGDETDVNDRKLFDLYNQTYIHVMQDFLNTEVKD